MGLRSRPSHDLLGVGLMGPTTFVRKQFGMFRTKAATMIRSSVTLGFTFCLRDVENSKYETPKSFWNLL